MKRLLGLGLLALCAQLGAKAADKPAISIRFDDDASSLLVSAQWTEPDGAERRETFSYGKDMHIVFGRGAEGWEKLDQDFRSLNWEAFLLPGADGFLLMEREYDGKAFRNKSLTAFRYGQGRAEMKLQNAQGSPYWSPDGKFLALVDAAGGKATVSIYSLEDGRFQGVKTDLDEAGLKAAVGEYRRARVCDDNEPCESAPAAGGDDSKKGKRLEGR